MPEFASIFAKLMPESPAVFLRALLYFGLSLLCAPLLQGIINRVKAKFAGRKGKPLLQLYFDLWKLLHKGAVYPQCTGPAFRAGPLVCLASALLALALVPQGVTPGLASFTGDFVLLAYLLAMGRFALMLAALDTGSAFEGMGASREASFGAIAEPALLLCCLVLGLRADNYTLAGMLGHSSVEQWAYQWPVLLLPSVAIFMLLLLENSRIPADDPNTHLELTMIHEVMVLDHGGPDLAFIEYASALKLWIFCSLVSGVMVPDMPLAVDGLFAFLGIFACAALVGVVESVTARLRMERVPHIPAIAAVMAALALLLLWR